MNESSQSETVETVQVPKEERTVYHRARLEVDKFNGTNNFGLWRTDVADALERLDLEACLRTEKPEEWSNKQ